MDAAHRCGDRFEEHTALMATGTNFAALIAVPGTPAAQESDYSKVTCRASLASGRANMAALISFLWGYHAGKGGVVPFDPHSPFGASLGYYCRSHPAANLIESSERILSELDRGI